MGPPPSGAIGSRTGSLGSLPTPTASPRPLPVPQLPQSPRSPPPHLPPFNAATELERSSPPCSSCCGIPPRVTFQPPRGGGSGNEEGLQPLDGRWHSWFPPKSAAVQGIPQNPKGSWRRACTGCLFSHLVNPEMGEGQGGGSKTLHPQDTVFNRGRLHRGTCWSEGVRI